MLDSWCALLFKEFTVFTLFNSYICYLSFSIVFIMTFFIVTPFFGQVNGFILSVLVWR